MKRWLSVVLCLLLPGTAAAMGSDAARSPVRASMLVTGVVEVAPNGSVARFSLDHPEKLPAPVTSMLARAIPAWKFEPAMANGQPVAAKTRMGLRIVATPLDGDKVRLALAGAWFGQRNPGIAAVHQPPPVYPQMAVQAHVSGTVFLLLRVDQAGKVHDAAVHQVDLGVLARHAEAERWRRVLGHAALDAARRWDFTPATGASPYRVVGVPVRYDLRRGDQTTRTGYGQWRVYVPGPVQLVPWLDNRLISGAADAMPDGALGVVGNGPRLLTPIHGA